MSVVIPLEHLCRLLQPGLLLFLGFFQLSQLFSQHVSGLILLTLQLIV